MLSVFGSVVGFSSGARGAGVAGALEPQPVQDKTGPDATNNNNSGRKRYRSGISDVLRREEWFEKNESLRFTDFSKAQIICEGTDNMRRARFDGGRAPSNLAH